MWSFASWHKFLHRCEPLLPGFLLSGIIVGLSSVGAFEHLEHLSADSLTRLRGERPWSDELLVIGIDEHTLDDLGPFPLARRYYADLLKVLSEADASIVTFDILMTHDSPDNAELAEAMVAYKNNAVVLAAATNKEGRFLESTQSLLDSAIATGHINQAFDTDGITRRHILYTYDNHSLASATAKTYSLTTDLITLPQEQQIYINWPGAIENISYASLVDVLTGKIPSERLKDKIVFVGSTATAEDQQLRTPFDSKDPVWGVYVHAAVMDNLLEQNWLRVPDKRWVLLAILLAGPLMSWGLKGRSFLGQIVLWAGCVSLWFLLCLGVRYQNIVLPLATPIVLLSLTEGLIVFTDRLRSSAILQARNEFLGTMSHELRTPLNAIIGISEMMQETHLDPRQREFSSTIQNSSQALLALINDVLDFSKIEAGRLVLEEHPVNLRNAIEESLDIVSTRAANKPLELVYMVDPQTPAVIVSDPIRLRQILLNLLSNAVKFTEEGEVAVILQPAANDELGAPVTRWTHSTEQSILLLFAVRDTGIGIPADRIGQIFEPFRQASTSTTRKYGGTGLGLTISKRLAENMGGRLWVESELNQGSTFFFTIRAQVDPVTVQPEQPEALAAWAHQRILVVDKNSTRRTALAWQLEALDIEPIFTRSVAEALLLIQQGQQFDGVILDAAITKLDSMSAVESLRQAMDKSIMPLIVLADIQEKLSHSERDDVAMVWKPVKQAALYRALMQIHPTQATVAMSRPDPSDIADGAEELNVSLKVLVADDNPVNQRVAQHMLQLLGHQADMVSTGGEAFEAVEQGDYDVVLMDMRMPNMGGVEATRCIRQLGQKISQPWIIAMTANASSEDRDRCLKVGMNDYLSKPIRRDSLSQTLMNVNKSSVSMT
ncbi:CHASE2 domain-containing protein [Leptothoe sp. PORK10 BA2]|uniref:CHASE2 domain-containing protein n=1 Tax=Leptothoe sp. PORK10 BA2 TaxID=3110254 RepID=UPI002B1FF433|nr:CHASE2 domain-containing protein [Leptothoe sp. PORK10 BA2]